MLQVICKNTAMLICKMFLKLTIGAPKYRKGYRFYVHIVDFKQILFNLFNFFYR